MLLLLNSKVDALNRPDFEALGLTPFTYPMKGKEVALSYWSAPDAIFDEPTWLARPAAIISRVDARKG